jgi:hypothetical protein
MGSKKAVNRSRILTIKRIKEIASGGSLQGILKKNERMIESAME